MIECENCGHCTDLSFPNEGKDPEVVKTIRLDASKMIMEWIRDSPYPESSKLT